MNNNQDKNSFKEISINDTSDYSIYSLSRLLEKIEGREVSVLEASEVSLNMFDFFQLLADKSKGDSNE